MRVGHLLFSVVHLFVVLIILGLGMFFVVLQGSYSLRIELEKILISDGTVMLKIGIVLLATGVLLLFGVYKLNARHYLTLKMSGSKVLIDEAIIRDYLRGYWKEVFPQQDIVSEVVMHLPQKLAQVQWRPDPGKPSN